MEFFNDFYMVEEALKCMDLNKCESVDSLMSTLKEKGSEITTTIAMEVFSVCSPEKLDRDYVDRICLQRMTPPSLPPPLPATATAIPDMKTRRKIKKWSVVEENVLKEGVERYGEGNWTAILKSSSHIFVRRTAVDLKDKWRNMQKKR